MYISDDIFLKVFDNFNNSISVNELIKILDSFNLDSEAIITEIG